jgi:hypothetical protein
MTYRTVLLGALTLASMLGGGCVGVPEDTKVEALEVQAWGGMFPICTELEVDLENARLAGGECEAVDTTNGIAVAPDVIAALRAGIDESEFSGQNVEPPPDCPTCPTRAYRVVMSSESAGVTDSMRIVPAASLVQALAPLGAP